jgi:carbonic anhydrase
MKQINKNHFSVLIFAVVCFMAAASILNAQLKESGEEKSLQLLLEGNKRFSSGNLDKKDYAKERAELTKGQDPYAIILSCSDSRVPPEIIFDESLGKLFIVRVAGNVVDSVTLGSIEYAAEHLHVKLLVVLGHESCGAVKATLEGGEVTPNLAQIVKRIEPAVKKTLAQKLEKTAQFDFAIEENVKDQIAASLFNSKVLKELFESKELQIAGAVYSLKTGTVKLLHTEIKE